MSASPERALRFTFGIVILIISGALLLFPLRIGVWLPDLFWSRSHILASHTSTNGYRFRVIQHWNSADFYSTELHITAPDGRTEVRTLDGDDSKSWSVPLVVNETSRVVLVTLGRGRTRKESW
ncbi:MAG TPA: hypothetical protein VK633_00070 [Verrucomicrobiae bacterium]|nr:hypothetical protein [Verrucomicrobiae bacterium]